VRFFGSGSVSFRVVLLFSSWAYLSRFSCSDLCASVLGWPLVLVVRSLVWGLVVGVPGRSPLRPAPPEPV
jgi:hypothetical protein